MGATCRGQTPPFSNPIAFCSKKLSVLGRFPKVQGAKGTAVSCCAHAQTHTPESESGHETAAGFLFQESRAEEGGVKRGTCGTEWDDV